MIVLLYLILLPCIFIPSLMFDPPNVADRGVWYIMLTFLSFVMYNASFLAYLQQRNVVRQEKLRDETRRITRREISTTRR